MTYTPEVQKIYNKEYYKSHKEEIKKQKLLYNERNMKTILEKARIWNAKPENKERRRIYNLNQRILLRKDIFDHYGQRCSCPQCPETNPAFLTIDHINGCGTEHRKKVGSGDKFYRWLQKNNYPEGFRTLCYNCNSGRAINKGICPHLTKPT